MKVNIRVPSCSRTKHYRLGEPLCVFKEYPLVVIFLAFL